jgi:hypothetical protein
VCPALVVVLGGFALKLVFKIPCGAKMFFKLGMF